MIRKNLKKRIVAPESRVTKQQSVKKMTGNKVCRENPEKQSCSQNAQKKLKISALQKFARSGCLQAKIDNTKPLFQKLLKVSEANNISDECFKRLFIKFSHFIKVFSETDTLQRLLESLDTIKLPDQIQQPLENQNQRDFDFFNQITGHIQKLLCANVEAVIEKGDNSKDSQFEQKTIVLPDDSVLVEKSQNSKNMILSLPPTITREHISSVESNVGNQKRSKSNDNVQCRQESVQRNYSFMQSTSEWHEIMNVEETLEDNCSTEEDIQSIVPSFVVSFETSRIKTRQPAKVARKNGKSKKYAFPDVQQVY